MSSNSETNQSGFFRQLQAYGIRRIILSYDFLIALIIFTILFQDYLSRSGNFKTLDVNGISGIVTITSAIFAIIIAAIAIILSFSGTKFAEFLREHKKLHSVLFTFWFCSVTHLTVILIAFAKYIINIHPPYWITCLYSALVISLFVYAILQTFYAVASIMRFAYFLEFFERSTKK